MVLFGALGIDSIRGQGCLLIDYPETRLRISLQLARVPGYKTFHGKTHAGVFIQFEHLLTCVLITYFV